MHAVKPAVLICFLVLCGCSDSGSEAEVPSSDLGPDMVDVGADGPQDVRGDAPEVGPSDVASDPDAQDMSDGGDGALDGPDTMDSPDAISSDAVDSPDAMDAPDTSDAPDTDADDGGDDVAPDLPPDGPEYAGTTEGVVIGEVVADGDIVRFLGVPYARPPTGALRWKSPRRPAVRAEPLAAQEFGAACSQSDDSWVLGQGLSRSEDCLTLNIWSPVAPREPAPVMVWVHGGAFLLGAGAEPQFDGTELARRGAVVVTFNYRLGVAGFLVHEALLDTEDLGQPSLGNYGLLDMVAVLQWVRDNAASFGGDPERVTLFGESAGGISVCALLTSPVASGLFHRAIMQSGFCTVEAARLDEGTELLPPAVEIGERLAQEAGCAGPEAAACLRGLPMDALMAAAQRLGDEQISIGIAVDDHVLHDTPMALMQAGMGADVPVIAGTVADEGTVFLAGTRIDDEEDYRQFLDSTFTDALAPFILVLYPARDFETPWHAAAAVMGDALFTCPTRETLRAHVRAGNQGWLYYFGHITAEGRRRGLGAYHASEVPFIFGTQRMEPGSAEVAELSGSLWASFAAQGRPSADAVAWPPYSVRIDPVLEIDADPVIIEQWRDDRCRFWAGGD
jgi:para-nitrobenzyl esterase